MKIIALSDLHNATKNLEQLAESMSAVDLILLVGDMTNNGKTENIAGIINLIRQHNQSILAITGNWDGREVSEYLQRENISIDRTHKLWGEMTFVGVGGSLVSGNAPNEFHESDFELFLSQAVHGLDVTVPFVFVSHQPPFGTLVDKTWLNSQAGSKSVRSFIEKMQPLICFTGHIHEGVGIDAIGRTQIINPGPVWKNQYAYAEINSGQVDCLEIRRF